MKIGIDISQIVYGTGVSWYTRSLVESLLKLDKENKYVLFGGSLRRVGELREFARGKFFPIPPSLADFIWNRLHLLPIEKLVGRLDVFHSSDWAQPPSRAFKITTVHDLSPLKFPDETPSKIVAVHKRRLFWVKKEVDRIIVPSRTVKKDLIEYGFDEKKLRVVPEAPRSVFKPTEKKVIKGDYLLAVGVGKRKNTERIIEASKGLKLVIVGRPMATKEKENVIFLGQVSDEKLASLYSHAQALVYPSLYEGFGLPILEAFACSCPVVTSKVSAMAETGDAAAVLVDPTDTDSIKRGIERVVKERSTLVKKGFSRVKKFSWEKTARETLKVYKESL